MFYKELINDSYFIWSDEHKWKFWPFTWVFIKNSFSQNFPEEIKSKTKEYQNHNFVIWITENKIFIINKFWIKNIL